MNTLDNKFMRVVPQFRHKLGCLIYLTKSVRIGCKSRLSDEQIAEAYRGVGAWARLSPNDQILYQPQLLGEHVVIVGGYNGVAPARMLRQVVGIKSIDIYEPLPEFVSTLNARFENESRVSIYPFALFNRDGREEMIEADDHSTLVSTSRTLPSAVSVTGHRLVEVRDARVIFEHENETMSVFMNCEGSEYVIIERLLSSSESHRIRTMLIQFHKVGTKSLTPLLEARMRLDAAGFRPVATYDFAWDIWMRDE